MDVDGIIEWYKYRVDGIIEWYKSRLVAKVYTKTYVIDYLETFGHVKKMDMVRI